MLFEHPLYQEDLSLCTAPGIPLEKLRGKSLLLTGATGMIGAVFVDSLMKCNQQYGLGLQIFALVRDEKNFMNCFSHWKDNSMLQLICHDIKTPLQANQTFDYIIHAASNTHPNAYATDPIGTMLTNLLGGKHLLEYAAKYPVQRFMFLSTVEIYGENRGNTIAFREEDCGYIDCNTLRAGYPESKRAGEALCNAYAKQYGIDIVIPRICRVYGPTLRATDSKALTQFLRNGVHGKDIVLKSDGKQYYSYCYAADVARALLTVLLLGEKGHAYNIADKQSDITLRELAQMIADQTGVQVVFALPNSTEAAGFSKAQTAVLNPEKINKLGWRANYSIAQGVSRTMRIFKETGWGISS